MNNAILAEERRMMNNFSKEEWESILKSCPTNLMHIELACRAIHIESQNETARRVLNATR